MLKYLIQKEFLQIRRNSFLPRLIILFPIMMMCVMPWVMNQEVKNIRMDVVDNDRSTLSRQLIHSIEASNCFIFNGQKPNYEAALKDIEKMDADVVMVIPQHFSS
ncbi:MAG: ABC transporter permease, partial [Prevotella sp.]|nr:ABC transporter permease [Prevotella sp.]